MIKPYDALITRYPTSRVLADMHTAERFLLDRPNATAELDAHLQDATREIGAFVQEWHPHIRGWMAVVTDWELTLAWKAAYRAVGLYAFASVVIMLDDPLARSPVGPGLKCRPLMVARPRNMEFVRWGTLPGKYPHTPHKYRAPGVKHVEAPRRLDAIWKQIVRDYTRAGDVICDPFAGSLHS